MVLECSVMVLSFFSVGLPHCFYIIYFKSFKRLLLAYGCFNNHNIYILSQYSFDYECNLPESDVRASFSSFFFSRCRLSVISH